MICCCVVQMAAQRAVLELVRAMCPGVQISRVVAVDNPELETRFGSHYTSMVRLCTSTNFRPAEYAKMASKDKQTILAELGSWLRATKSSGLLGATPDDSAVVRFGWAFNGFVLCCFVSFVHLFVLQNDRSDGAQDVPQRHCQRQDQGQRYLPCACACACPL